MTPGSVESNRSYSLSTPGSNEFPRGHILLDETYIEESDDEAKKSPDGQSDWYL